MTDEIFEEPEFARLEEDFLAGTHDPVGKPVELEVGDAVARGLAPPGRPSPPRQHLDPGEELGEGIRLRQVIVASRAQPFDPVINLSERREDQGRRLHLLLPQGADQGQAVELGEHAINHEHVVSAFPRHGVAVEAVIGAIGRMARFPKRLGQISSRLAVVFYDQNVHCGILDTTGGRRQGLTHERQAG
jgi:hypothetical protein